MSTHKLKFTAGVVVLAALSCGLFWSHYRHQRLAEENSRLRQALAEVAIISDERGAPEERNNELGSTERAELLKLRGTVGLLRKQLAAATNSELRRLNIATPSSEPSPDVLSPAITYQAEAAGRLLAQQTLVTGGWQTQPGKRTMVLLTPEVLAAAGGQQISMQTRWVEASEETLARLGLDATGTTQILAGAQMQAMLETLNATSGVDILSAPRVVAADGQTAQIEVTEIKTIGEASYELGPKLNVVSRIAPDGAIDVNVAAVLNRLRERP